MAYNPPTYGESGEVYTDNVRNSLEHVRTAAEAAQAAADGNNASVVAASQAADQALEVAEAAKAFVEAPTDSRVATLVQDSSSSTGAALNAAYAGLGPAATGTPATDRANLQAFINAAATAGKPRRLPGGTYNIDATLTIPSNVDIDFGAATVKRVGGVFDMLTNADATNGNSGITLRNLTIDGDKDTDALVAANAGDRFGGLVLTKVTDSHLDNVTVIGTVNNEATAGIYLNQCSDVIARDLNGWNNDCTAILLNACSRVTIDGSLTYDNLGSGISSTLSPECAYLNIVTHDNGYSNLSVNGLRNRVSNVLSYNSGMSGVNVGHLNDAADSELVNVTSYDNTYEGISVSSSRIHVTNFAVHGNARNNIRTMTGAVACRFVNGVVRNSAGGQGVFFESGAGHSITQCDIHDNYASGVYVPSAAAGVQVGPGVRCYNNGRGASTNTAGILLATATNARIMATECYDDQTTKTQETGVWISGGSGHILMGNRVEGNKTYNVRESSSPKYVNYQGDGATSAARITSASVVFAASLVGFYGVAPVARAADPGTATGTDAAVINNIVTALRNIGIVT